MYTLLKLYSNHEIVSLYGEIFIMKVKFIAVDNEQSLSFAHTYGSDNTVFILVIITLQPHHYLVVWNFSLFVNDNQQ